MSVVSSERVALGIDCATNPRHVGLARIVLSAGVPRVDDVANLRSWDAIDATLCGWLTPRTLIALDAPLGWPRALGDVLHEHHAGDQLGAPPNGMFRRLTDDVVAREVGKRSLDVGADRIARTAHAALSLLQRLRERTKQSIPLSWEPGCVEGATAIEVYPAATLAGRGLRHTGYKGAKEEAASVRRELVGQLATEVAFDGDATEAMVASDHVLDAVICGLAASDFAAGQVIRPAEHDIVRREGWIWVRVSRPD